MYTITLSNGNILTTIPDTQLVSSYAGLDLTGKNYVGYGTILDNNLVHLTENFANATPPTNPLIGQLWYDSVSNTINFWNGKQFKSISIITSSQVAPLNPQEGDEWYDSINQQLNIWNGFEWLLIGPPNQGGAKEGFIVASIPSNTGNIYYLELYTNNTLLGIVSSVELINPDIVGFGNIRPGWNFVTNPESAPSIIKSGIYNISEITLGDNDQLALETDEWDNCLIQVNNDNVMIATNGNASSNTAAYTEWSNGNIAGTVYFDNIIANKYGNLPSITPGLISQIIYNNGIELSGSNAIAILSGNVTASIDNLNVSTETTIDGTLNVNGNVVGNLNVLDSVITSELVATDIWGSTYHNLPPFTTPGTTGEVIYNNSGAVDATSAITVGAGNIVTISNLSVNSSTSIGGNLNVTNFANVGALNSNGNLSVDGLASFNNGSNKFTLPNNRGTVNGGALLTDTLGGTFWSSINLAAWLNSLTLPGYQYFPSGLLVQWGTVQGNGSVATFPITFPHALLGVVLSPQYNTSIESNTRYVQVDYSSGQAPTTSQFQLTVSNSASGTVCFWVALGF